MQLIQDLYLFMTALFAALIMVPFLHRWALNTGAVDRPDARKVHLQITPRIGGIAIFMSILFSMLVFVDMNRPLRGILAGGLILFFTGLIDDLHGITPRQKFIGEIAAALIAIGVGNLCITRLGDIFGLGAVVLPHWLGIPFTLFALVGVINAINLIDGLDGLAGGISLIAASTFFVLAVQDGNFPAVGLCAALLGALLGFLKYNFYPARIFMGDTGSLGVGYLLACIAVLLTQSPAAKVNPAIPVLILGVPILDTLFVMINRMRQGKSPFAPDMTHVHHKFLNLGFQHRFTVLILFGICLFWAIFSISFSQWPAYRLLAVFISASAVCYAVLRHLLRNRHRYHLLRFDSPRGFRESVTYERLAEKADLLIPGLLALIIIYLTSAAFDVARFQFTGFWTSAAILFLGGIGLFVITRDTRNHFLLALLYFGCLIITFAVGRIGGHSLMTGVPNSHLNGVLFGSMALIVFLKMMFRKSGEFFLSTVDLLIMGISIVLSVIFYQTQDVFHFSGPFLKGVVLFLAIKVISANNRFQAGLAVSGVLGLLLVIAVRSYVS